jgi:hypothetical protein
MLTQLADVVGEEGRRSDGLAEGLSIRRALLGLAEAVAAERVAVRARGDGVVDHAGTYAAQKPGGGRLQEEPLARGDYGAPKGGF